MPAADILKRIVASKREELAEAKQQVTAAELRAQTADGAPTRDFVGALRSDGEVRLIAEVKKASPSAGLIRADFHPVRIAETYREAGASCISVLTDAQWFCGSPQFLRDIRVAVDLPLLRKDFVVDPYQLYEARAWGADAALLIVAILSPSQLRELADLAAELQLAVLVETHTEDEVHVAVELGAELIGINNRDLRVFETDLQTTLRLRPEVPEGTVVVSESGIRQPDDVALLRQHGVNAMLIGEALMREADLAAKTRSMVAAGRA